MGSINLYRIDPEKKFGFLQELGQKMELRGTERMEPEDAVPAAFGFALYICAEQKQRGVSWNWALEEFGEAAMTVPASPSGLILVEIENGQTYAVTLGHSFFLADRFCDRDFGFRFARKLRFSQIRTTTLTTPSSRRNKTVSTYIHYSELEFDSGESFAKLKANVDPDDAVPHCRSAIEVGSSLRFSVETLSLAVLRDVILHVENTIETGEDRCRIPVFSRIRDPERIAALSGRLMRSFAENPGLLNPAELDIVGVTEVFNRADGDFELRYHGRRQRIGALTAEAIREFCREFGWDYETQAPEITVCRYLGGSCVEKRQVRELIDYTDDPEKCLLSRGFWYQYNEDYLCYLRDSIAEIDAEYHPEFDFSGADRAEFLERKFEEEAALYPRKSEGQIRQALAQKYYAERCFNLLREERDGFRNFDRQDVQVDGHTVEVMDLWRNGMMCAVKLGSASSKLCCAVDQSLTALRLLRKGMLPEMPEISTVVLWFVLERGIHIEDENGRPDLNRLEMLMLKNRLDQWKKEVRLQGLRPLIYINYREK